jgi:hypothetical protein
LLVDETPSRVALFVAPGVRGKGPEGGDRSDYVGQLLHGWQTRDHVWHTHRALRLTPFDAPYSVDHYWLHATGQFRGYQINLQEPLRRSRLGFDTLDHELDIWIAPDGSWRWKDVESFERGVREGAFSQAEGAAVRTAADELAGRLDELIPTGWEAWEPNPDWPLPILPDGWEEP